MSTTEKYTSAEITEAQKFSEFFFDLFENSRDNLIYYLDNTALLDWFGHTIKGPKNIVTYLKNSAGSCKHIFSNSQPAHKIGYRESHIIKLPSEPREYGNTETPLTHNSEHAPSNLTSSPVIETRIVEQGQGDGSHNCESSESPRKKCKINSGREDGAAVVPKIKYIVSEGHIEFHRKSTKKLQSETKWSRPCKLEIAYSATDMEDCVIYMLIYQANMKCRRNLLKEFELCGSSD
ncbi:hypothetical protein FQA39_LY09619 [Lamprigera yunnana]|nr:hypothetical protein FQA39_LY09619 [Lamprigera yunnana]